MSPDVTPNFKEPKVSKTKKRKTKTLPRILDETCGEIVRARGRCENCGSTENLQWAHGFSRRYRNVRWDLRNGFCLCAGCHYKFTVRPLEWDDWLRDRWGEDLYREMRALALATTKVDHRSLLDALGGAA